MRFNIKDILINDENTNLILHGREIDDIYSKTIEILNSISNKIPSTVEKDKLVFIINDCYVSIDMKNITLKNTEVFFSVLIENIHTKNCFVKRKRKYILFHNYESVKTSIQNRLRVIIEKYHISSCFIILSKRYEQIINPIKSRSLCIRIPMLTNEEKRVIVRSSIKESYNLKKSHFYDIVYELTKGEDILLLCKYYNYIDKKSYYDRIFTELMNILNNNLTESTYKDIKMMAYYIEFYCIDIFNYNLINKFLRKEFTLQTKLEILSIFTISNYYYRNVYRKLIVIESLLFKLNYLMSTGNYKIYRDD